MKHPQREQAGPGQESVWDYPRPPGLEPVSQRIRVVFNDTTIVDTTNAVRILETSHAPTYYMPPRDVRAGVLIPTDRETFCEWKGVARYLHVEVDGKRAENAAWCYPNPVRAYAALRDFVAIYAQAMDACYVGDELVRPQDGSFYGGWVTKNLAGPIKGAAGTLGW